MDWLEQHVFPFFEGYGSWIFWAVLGFLGYLQLREVLKGRRNWLDERAGLEKSEAMFKTMFPELQPHFHPERVDEYVFARLDRMTSEKSAAFTETTWEHPAGFPAAASARLEPTEKGERTTLLDSGGRTIAQFLFEARKEADGGVIRMGKGKITATRDAKDRPYVRYWHPDREFKWKYPKNWSFVSRLADEPISSSDTGSSFSSSSSSSSAIPAAGAAAGLAGSGGTFDGGGASSGWDDRGSGGSSSSGGDSSTTGDSSSDTSY